jgi:hypothetical protein
MHVGNTYYIVVDGADKTEAGLVHMWYYAGVSVPEPFYSYPANAGISFVIYLIFRFSRRIRVKPASGD